MSFWLTPGIDYFIAPLYRPLCAPKHAAIQEYIPLYAWAVRTNQVPQFLVYFFGRWFRRWPILKRGNIRHATWLRLIAEEKERLEYELKNRAGYLIEQHLREEERRSSMVLVTYLITCLRNIHLNEHTTVAAGSRCPSCTLIFDECDSAAHAST
ncbi:hypothetical protein DFP72DRAFT_1062556 [Ephemerocybe angulata]|uniref:Uncharacterized protein n=1 Tax=Ephemerocybe angulata TaxID=980116 RepID=A0A8H6IBI7_9AGAR|nr:hypothetical protein DFP72DRAFT_1067532 [Tulosesus angulatus]KAF6760816.1 hypothetical protein DFP72DRAFT_1062556 [Tulosesus angulatus]